MRRLFALLCLLPLAPTALAAESFDACTGFIDALPATISTQGTWCLRKDLSTAITGGAAITIATNNVTIDCNGFKLGGLAAGPGSLTTGVFADSRLNATVRNCALRGFHHGVGLVGSGGGHLVEDNRIDQSLNTGIFLFGDGNLVQRNRIMDTGSQNGFAIHAEADIRDNTIENVMGADPKGIAAGGWGSEVRGNRVRGLSPEPGTLAVGIITFGGQISIVDNRVIGSKQDITDGIGILSSGANLSFCRDNLIANYETGMTICEDNGGNVVHGGP